MLEDSNLLMIVNRFLDLSVEFSRRLVASNEFWALVRDGEQALSQQHSAQVTPASLVVELGDAMMLAFVEEQVGQEKVWLPSRVW